MYWSKDKEEKNRQIEAFLSIKKVMLEERKVRLLKAGWTEKQIEEDEPYIYGLRFN